MNAAEFAPIYVSLQAVCGKPHKDEDLNTEHMKQFFLSLKQFEAPLVKQAVARVIQNFGRTQFDTRWPKPGAVMATCEDIRAGQTIEPDHFIGMTERQRKQVSEMLRIDRIIQALPGDERKALNYEAAIEVLEPTLKGICSRTKRPMPEREEDETAREWAIKLAMRGEELRDEVRMGDLGDGPGGTFSSKLMVLCCKELLESGIIVKMREIAKERGLV